MVVIDQYLELYEAEQVSSGWKGFQIFFYVLGALNSIAAAYTFGYLSHHYLDYNCILYSNVKFIPDASFDAANDSLTTLNLEMGTIDTEHTVWGKSTVCAYCQYVPICSFIFCFVWATFFTMCGKGGRTEQGLPAPWRIVYPALIFNFVFFIISLVAVSMLQGGIGEFCSNFMINMNEISCDQIDDYNTKPPRQAYLYILLAQLFGWLNVIMWLLSIGILVLRCICVSDFVLYKIEILTPGSSQTATAQGSDTVQNDETASPGTKLMTKASIEERQLLSFDYESVDDETKPFSPSATSLVSAKSEEENESKDGAVATKIDPQGGLSLPYSTSSISVGPKITPTRPFSPSSLSVTLGKKEEKVEPEDATVVAPNDEVVDSETVSEKEKSDTIVTNDKKDSKPDTENPGSST